MTEAPKYNPENKVELQKFCWGEVIPVARTRTGNYQCRTYECMGNRNPIGLNPIEENLCNIIGVGIAPPEIESVTPLAMVCKCPFCQQDYWFHISTANAEIIKDMLGK
ncbi:MAG: hypothetical protein WCX97_03785 [Candidatus Magasanikbacteria bacterium]